MAVLRLGLASVALLIAAGCVTDMSREDIAGEYHNLGNGFYELKRWDRAIRYYELALERNPEVSLTRWNLARAYYQAGKYESAESILAEWLSRDTDAIEAREMLALVYHGQGRSDRALEILDDVLSRAPESTRAMNNRAVILWEVGRLAEASETLERYLAYEPYNPGVLYNLMVLADEQGLTRRAQDHAEAYLSVAADLEAEREHVVDARYVLARANERGEAYYRALEIYGEIVEQDERQASAWFGQAAILLTSVEDPSRGYEALRKAMDQGYRDKAALATLLAREDLLDRERVEGLLRDREVYPGDEEIRLAREATQSDVRPVVDTPVGPWAEPGVDRPALEVPEPAQIPPEAP